MPAISAFRGMRYDLGHVGSLSDVVAPPYDVIDAELQDALYRQHVANFVRLVLNREEPGDDEHSNRYTRARRFLRNWQREGVLFTEADPAIYVYHQTFTVDDNEHTRRGFMCRVQLERFGRGNIHPHEETHASAKADRLRLWQTCKANLSQVFGLYPDAENKAQGILEQAIVGKTPLEATDHLGVVHRLWPVTDVDIITQLVAAMGPKPVYIADGHHRYETACNYRDAIAAEHGGQLLPDHPASFVLMMCVSMDDSGMLVLPTHRLFRGLPPITYDELQRRLGDYLQLSLTSYAATEADVVWAEVESENAQACMAFYTAEDQKWTIAYVTDVGHAKLADIAPEHTAEWRGLGVSILHRLVVDTLLDQPNLPAPKYVHSIDEVVAGIEQGDTAGRDATGQRGDRGRFELAAMVMPATLEHIRTISSHGERMPAKSTYFYPKLLSGLVINPLE